MSGENVAQKRSQILPLHPKPTTESLSETQLVRVYESTHTVYLKTIVTFCLLNIHSLASILLILTWNIIKEISSHKGIVVHTNKMSPTCEVGYRVLRNVVRRKMHSQFDVIAEVTERAMGAWGEWVTFWLVTRVKVRWPMTHVGIHHTLKYTSGSWANRNK